MNFSTTWKLTMKDSIIPFLKKKKRTIKKIRKKGIKEFDEFLKNNLKKFKDFKS